MNKYRILAPVLLLGSAVSLYAQERPNIVFILTDDQGYQDLGCYGSPQITTPSIDRMAREGLRLTDYYVSSSVSSASRAGLLTGRWNYHNGVYAVLWPGDEGLSLEETTLAEALKTQGYATACFGKWHLGDAEGHLPTERGFDNYLGIPYSNDMYIGPTQKISRKAVFREGFNMEKTREAQQFVQEGHSYKELMDRHLKNACPLLEQDEIIEFPCDQATLTRRYFDGAISFIRKNRKHPFFVYLTPNMPHIPLHASADFKGKSRRGLYGDVVEEIDWNVGRLLDFIDKEGLGENTLVIFSSDNGPWLQMKEHGGSALPLRDGKFTQYEGGVRTPCIIRWKGTVPAGRTSSSLFASVDWFPTLLKLAGGKTGDRPAGRTLDGMDQLPFLKNPSLQLRDEYPYVWKGKVVGVRKGDWIYLPAGGRGGKPVPPELFNIRTDLSEKDNLHADHPEKIKEMKALMESYRTGN